LHFWQTKSNPKTGRDVHSIRGDGGHALLLPVVTPIFQALGVSASLWDGTLWWPFYSQPNLAALERIHAVETRRAVYNQRNFAKVVARRKPVLAEHAGYSDFFVPIVVHGKTAAVIVVGPIATRRPTAREIVARWRNMSGHEPRLRDPEFDAYLRLSLETLVLQPAQLKTFERLLVALATLMAGVGRADELANRAQGFRQGLERVRLAERMWAAARDMLDERSAAFQFSAASAYELRALGLESAADQVLVGLTASSDSSRDSVEEIVRADGFQRAATLLAEDAGGMIAGRVGDRGIVFLLASAKSVERRSKRFSEIVRRARAMARRDFGLSLHFGATEARGSDLGRRYALALDAAEDALVRRESLVIAKPSGKESASPLRALRTQLAKVAEEHPELLPAEFDRYAEAIQARSGSDLARARTELELASERVTDVFLRFGLLEPRAADALRANVGRLGAAAHSVKDLLASYQRSVLELSDLAKHPVVARQDQSLERVLAYIHDHHAERLSLERVARLSGFSRTYFSELFKRRRGVTFEKYVAGLRLERAKQLLAGTNLSALRVAEASGFRTPQYLSRVFRQELRMTPLEYRRGLIPKWMRDERKAKSSRQRTD
jgi:AraC-like DNA-binding protein